MVRALNGLRDDDFLAGLVLEEVDGVRGMMP